MGSVIIAVMIFYLRTRSQAIQNTGLIVGQDVMSPIEQIPNITQRLTQQAQGSYDPTGSTATSASYPGVLT
jgi:hypothetical protein